MNQGFNQRDLAYLNMILLNIAQLRLQLKHKCNYNFGTTEHRLKIQKAQLVRIKFPIELCNFYLAKNIFIELFYPIKPQLS